MVGIKRNYTLRPQTHRLCSDHGVTSNHNQYHERSFEESYPLSTPKGKTLCGFGKTQSDGKDTSQSPPENYNQYHVEIEVQNEIWQSYIPSSILFLLVIDYVQNAVLS